MVYLGKKSRRSFMEKFEDTQKGNQKLKIKEGRTTQKSMKKEKQRSTKHYSVN